MLTSACDLLDELRRLLRENAYPGYVYGYPHKKAYRTLPSPRPLPAVWQNEDKQALFCYLHIPFCNQRCSFCNLFTYVPGDSPSAAYVRALGQEMAAYARVLRPSWRIARLYLGGGTPTFLSSQELHQLVGLLEEHLGVRPDQTHGCIEASPETLDEDKVAVLRDLGFQRISLGVQSFVPGELQQVNRRFDFQAHARAVRWIGQAGFPHFNIDLIYGLPGQTAASWRESLEQAIATPCSSLFLYPLYIRPLTGLERRAETLPCPTPHQMGEFYDHAVERLRQAGFVQLTMRQFRRDPEATVPSADLEYRCQRDGMLGLGAGARSYTTLLHYSTPWRMITRNIRAVVEDYTRRMAEDDTAVRHGFELDLEERQRRFIIQSLLYDGLDRDGFREQFGIDACEVLPAPWEALEAEDLIAKGPRRVCLTARGVRHADIVGQLFFSERVRGLTAAWEYDT
jgi:oxygen-independent coproporphyrinogen-3 oxidase